MLKTQKDFNPLECGLCKETDFIYRRQSEELYRLGFRGPVSRCRRLMHRNKKGYENA